MDRIFEESFSMPSFFIPVTPFSAGKYNFPPFSVRIFHVL